MNVIDGFILSVLVVLFIMQALVLRKLKKIHVFCWKLKDQISESSVHTVRNLESLDVLYRELQFNQAILPTMGFAGSPDFLRLISDYVSKSEAKYVLECSSGVSTIVLAQALKLKGEGHVYSLENDERYAEESRHNLKKYGLEEWATVITAPLTNMDLDGREYQWYSIEGLPSNVSFDALIVDGPPWSVPKSSRYPAGPLLFKLLHAGAHVFLDDYVRKDEQAVVEMWMSENPSLTLVKHRFMKGCAELIKGSIS